MRVFLEEGKGSGGDFLYLAPALGGVGGARIGLPSLSGLERATVRNLKTAEPIFRPVG